ncbi:hypothetical protein KP509_10G005100 [Ceratopteris richardii]|uniref:Uncharacterized protein n=1 Tax=Ceratopteris richardii TaxID=49495 RepID=A0A8T2TVV3_CERRI|nr:hypothetical protein KP509_10G005100 [Ceratopteris richardii]
MEVINQGRFVDARTNSRPLTGRFPSSPFRLEAPRHGFRCIVSAFNIRLGGKGCGKCGGKGAVECPGCKGSGKNKKNGNLFERWKCYDCQGFGLVSCPSCGKGGLTPEQRGER